MKEIEKKIPIRMRPSRFGSSKRRSKGEASEEWLSLAPRRAVVAPALFLLKMLLKSSVSKAMAGGETAVNSPSTQRMERRVILQKLGTDDIVTGDFMSVCPGLHSS